MLSDDKVISTKLSNGIDGAMCVCMSVYAILLKCVSRANQWLTKDNKGQHMCDVCYCRIRKKKLERHEGGGVCLSLVISKYVF